MCSSAVRSSAFRRLFLAPDNRLKAELRTGGKAYELFGDRLPAIREELNARLAA